LTKGKIDLLMTGLKMVELKMKSTGYSNCCAPKKTTPFAPVLSSCKEDMLYSTERAVESWTAISKKFVIDPWEL
jgi:hypothetical protein